MVMHHTKNNQQKASLHFCCGVMDCRENLRLFMKITIIMDLKKE